MRIKVRDWQRDWIRDNGRTDELEVIIAKSDGDEIYCGNFAGIPKYELDKKVKAEGQILDPQDWKGLGPSGWLYKNGSLWRQPDGIQQIKNNTPLL